jgi:hypothetical protein
VLTIPTALLVLAVLFFALLTRPEIVVRTVVLPALSLLLVKGKSFGVTLWAYLAAYPIIWILRPTFFKWCNDRFRFLCGIVAVGLVRHFGILRVSGCFRGREEAVAWLLFCRVDKEKLNVRQIHPCSLYSQMPVNVQIKVTNIDLENHWSPQRNTLCILITIVLIFEITLK